MIMTKREMIMEAIESLGYSPQIDDDGDVFICYQMKNIFFVVGNEEEPYIAAILPQFTEVKEEQVTLALAACNKVSREVKLAKVYVDQTFKSVSASCEFYYTDEACLKKCIEGSLEILGVVRSVYFRTKTELSE